MMRATEPAAALETKLAAARTRLILEKPFLGALVMHLPLKAADPKWCATTATDARALYYNPAYIARLTLEQTQFALAHEAMHCALSHFNRRGHRMRHRWDVACDYAVNMILDEERMQPPAQALMNAAYRGLTAEEIYPLLHEDPPEQTQDLHLFDHHPGADGTGEGEAETPPPSESEGGQGESDDTPSTGQDAAASPAEHQAEGGPPAEPRAPPPAPNPEQLDEQWQGRLAAAAQAARQAGKLSPAMMRLVDELLSPQLPWRALLARYMMNVARDDYSFQRPARREGEALMPRLQSQGVTAVVVLDTSGSVTREELQAFLSEVDALKAQVRAQVILHACDDRLAEAGPWRFAQWEPLRLPDQLAGGGGTDFRPAFEWVEQERIRPDLLLYFTDAEGRFPPHAPDYPVVWLVKGRARVPFGARVQLN